MNFLDQLPTLAILCGALIWTINAIVNPLRDAIKDLKDVVSELKSTMARHEKDVRELELLVQEINDRSKGNQRRIESLEAKHEACHSSH